MKFRKKPVVVEAIQWFRNGDHPEDWPKDYPVGWEGKIVRYFRHPNIPGNVVCGDCDKIMHVHGWIDSGGLGHKVCQGDWIIKGEQGFYPLKPDIFEQTYERVEE